MRCAWGESEAMRAYHDEEWGRPVTDERGLFERLCLEAFQSGLSWSTILAKREGFRAAFAGFDADAVARFGAPDVARLMADAAIVRNRAKIDAAIANANAIVALRETGEPFERLVWSFRPAAVPAAANGEIPAQTPESKALAKALKARGFRFVGPTTAYALMQAAGLVNDHVAGCFVRGEVEAAQAAIA
jgi:DNA-3-methyladenine glycosylase I